MFTVTCGLLFALVYVGLTTKELDSRFSGHKSFVKKCISSKLSQCIVSNGGIDNFKIELIMHYSCRSKKELEHKEGYFISLMKPLCNTVIPGDFTAVGIPLSCLPSKTRNQNGSEGNAKRSWLRKRARPRRLNICP